LKGCRLPVLSVLFNANALEDNGHGAEFCKTVLQKVQANKAATKYHRELTQVPNSIPARINIPAMT